MPLKYDPESARTVYTPEGYALLVGGWRYRPPRTHKERTEELLMGLRYLRARYGSRPWSEPRREVRNGGGT